MKFYGSLLHGTNLICEYSFFILHKKLGNNDRITKQQLPNTDMTDVPVPNEVNFN